MPNIGNASLTRPPNESLNFQFARRIILPSLTKITQHFVLKIFTELQIASKNMIPVFGIASAKSPALWVWVVFWVGGIEGKIRRTRPLDLSAECIAHQQRRWRSTAVGLAWRVRVFLDDGNKDLPIFRIVFESSRRDSPCRVV
jgi:hypothetical protein